MTEPNRGPIEHFWLFWTEHRQSIERAIEAGNLMDWTGSLGARVKAIDPGLVWEIGKGERAQHYFCLAAAGDPTKRIIAERWLSEGPPADKTFEYYSARPGGGYTPGHKLAFGAHVFVAGEFRFALELAPERRRVHVDVWHPLFSVVERNLAGTATFVMLDNVFGEDNVERWLGAVNLVGAEPPRAVTFAELTEAVDDLRGGDETFTLLKGSLPDGSPHFIAVNLGIKRVDHLLMDLHIEIAMNLREPTEHGLTTTLEGDALNTSEDLLLELLGADAIYIGHETGGGRRVLHLHTANGGPAIGRIDEWASRVEWPVEVSCALDPQWEVLWRW